jgi:hypothetical protein
MPVPVITAPSPEPASASGVLIYLRPKPLFQRLSHSPKSRVLRVVGQCVIVMPMTHLTVTIEGRKYQIPQMWIVGATRTLGTVQAAVQRWHEQAVMAGE